MYFALLTEAIYVETNITVWSRQSWNAGVCIKDYCENMTWNLTQQFYVSNMKTESTFRRTEEKIMLWFLLGFYSSAQNPCASHPSLETITSAEQHSMVYIFSSFAFFSSLFQSGRGHIHDCFADHKNINRSLNSAQNYKWTSQHEAFTKLSTFHTL